LKRKGLDAWSEKSDHVGDYIGKEGRCTMGCQFGIPQQRLSKTKILNWEQYIGGKSIF